LTFDFAIFDLAVFDLAAARFDDDLDFPRLTAFFMIPPALPGPSVILAHLSPHWQGRRLAQGNNQTLLPITNPQRRTQTLPPKRLPPRAAIRQAGDRFNFDSPRIAQPSVTRVLLRVPGELAVEPSGERKAVPEIDLRAGEGEHQVPRGQGIVLPRRQTIRSN
jgi:hypothetical protein